jgi:hypothetical protein
MSNDIEKDLQREMDKDLASGIARLTPGQGMSGIPRLTPHPPKAAALSVAEQLLGVAESVKAIHKEMDELQAEMVRRLDALRSRLGSRG